MNDRGQLPVTGAREMGLPYEWVVGWRYTRRGRIGRRNGFLSFISGVSMLGIALGVAALIIVMSVVNGFQREVRERMRWDGSVAYQASGADYEGVLRLQEVLARELAAARTR